MEYSVIYIIGDVRSGSTLLDYLLSLHPEATSVGEMHRLSDFYYQKTLSANSWNYKCSCGCPVNECSFWQNIIDNINVEKPFKTRVPNKISGLNFFSEKLIKRSIVQIQNDNRLRKEFETVAATCWQIYEQIHISTKKAVIIDSSKNALQAYFLYKHRKADIYFILLERNICAVSYSKLYRFEEKKAFIESKTNNIYKHLLTSYVAVKKNYYIANTIQHESNQTVKRINYEELAQNPQPVIDEICDFVNLKKFVLSNMMQENKVQHVIGGSPSRYTKKIIKLDNRYLDYFKKNRFAFLFGKLLQNINN